MKRRTKSFKVLKRKVIYRGRVAKLYLETIRWKDGQTFKREIIDHPKSVVLLPLLSGNRIVLIRQFRAAVRKFIYEIPAGTTEPGETLLACGKRELAEEIGYKATRYRLLSHFYPAPGISTEEMFLYKATGLTKLAHPPPQDADEMITPVVVTVAKAKKMMARGQIVDGKTILGLTLGLRTR